MPTLTAATLPAPDTLARRALVIWPRLDRRALRHCHGDPYRIASLVARRTSLSVETIVGMLAAPRITPEERETWFG